MYTPEQLEEIGIVLNEAKIVAIKYRKLTGKPLGITSEVAEYEAAIKMNCVLCEARNPGYDLIDRENKRVQVKGRVTPIGRVPTINRNTLDKPWDYVLLVILDEAYNCISIYSADEETVENELSRERPRGGQKRRNMPISDFIRVSTKVWPD